MSDYKRRTRITGQKREAARADITKRYRDGDAIRQIAADIGRSYGFVHRVLGEADVPMRPRGGVTRGPNAPRRRKTVGS